MLSIAIAQINISPGRPDENTRAITASMARARDAGAGLVLFPEMAVPGYLLGDTWEQPAFLLDCEECGQEIIASSHGLAVMFGNVAVDWENRNNDGRVRKYNALFTAQNGVLIPPERGPLPYVIKALMPNYREFDDSRHFFSLLQLAQERGISPHELFSPVSFTILGKTYRAGCMLCEDGWSSDYSFSPMEELARQHADFMVNLSSSPYTLGKNNKRHR
ncbi:MAG: nitrilase-related carbon-nitrogen hydrolase, partial [Mailhella sp.]